MSSNTCFDNIDANVVGASIDLLLYEVGRCLMNAKHPLGILCSESSRRRHGVAAMSSDHLLISLEASDRNTLAASRLRIEAVTAYAPPELSEPAITSMRFIRPVSAQCEILDMLT